MRIARIIEKLIPSIIVQRFYSIQSNWIKAHKCDKYPIIPLTEIKNQPLHYRIKESTWESVKIAQRFEFSQECQMDVWFEAQAIIPLKCACVFYKSNIVLWHDGVIWDKCYYPNFSKIMPLDSNVHTYDRQYVWLRKNDKEELISGKVISLLGVHAAIWAHFINQYLPKLYYAERAGLLNENVTILIHPVEDSNIREIFDEYAVKYPTIKFLEVQDGTRYNCEELLYMPSASHMDDHAIYLQTCDIVIPKVVRDLLRTQLVQPLIDKIKNKPTKHTKLYIIRRDTYRKIINWQEIEKYFIDNGFYPVEGANLTLLEKADLFYHAQYIVGIDCAGWSNMMFCNQAKAIILSNIPHSIYPFVSAYAEMGNVDLLRVTGDDTWGSSPHVDSYIPLEKVKRAYNQLMKS